jgi:tetratricopeptide (TPR) repeat protein
MALEAKAEIQLGEKDNGIANFSRAIKLDPQNTEIIKDYAFALASHNLEYTQAISYAKKALELQSGNPDYIFVYAYCLFKDGQKEEALKWLQPALTKFPEHNLLRLLDMEINKNE